jgi:hypothetical protein
MLHYRLASLLSCFLLNLSYLPHPWNLSSIALFFTSSTTLCSLSHLLTLISAVCTWLRDNLVSDTLGHHSPLPTHTHPYDVDALGPVLTSIFLLGWRSGLHFVSFASCFSLSVVLVLICLPHILSYSPAIPLVHVSSPFFVPRSVALINGNK